MPGYGSGELGEQNPWGGLFGFTLIIPPGGGDDEDPGNQEPGADQCIHNHRAQMLDRLVEQFKNKPNIEELVSALAAPIQRLEDAFCQLLHERSLAVGDEPRTAVGEQLNVIGRIVGFRDRGTLSDADMERLIEATIRANRSTGRLEDFIAVTGLVTDTDTGIVLRRERNATLIVVPTTAETSREEADFLMRFLHRTALDGVRVILEFRPLPEDETFSFAGGPGLGFGEGAFAGARSNGRTNRPIT